VRTIEASGFHVQPYQTTVPSFGVWGFVLARKHSFDPPVSVSTPVRYLDEATLASLFIFPPDMAPLIVEINRLDNQILVRYYDAEWRRWS
jgi:spermidine synthase